MKAVLVVVVLLVTGVAGLGFYRGWFSLASDRSDAKSNVTLTVDQDKFQEDRKAATESVQGLGRPAKDKAAGPAEKITDGTMVSVNGGELTITDKEGKEHRHTLAGDVKVTCDARPCEAADLKAGMRVRVTTGDDAPHAATRVEALDKNAAFEKAG
jgi:uncharacterized protein YdeI (BOF family)